MNEKYYLDFTPSIFFSHLQRLGREAVTELRKLDAQHIEKQRNYHEELTKGNITRQGYERYLSDLDKARDRFIDEYNAKLEALKTQFSEATDKHTTPSPGYFNVADMEILKNFDLSTSEFESLAQKYNDNPTMGRMLEKYRVDHKVDTSWRYQTADERKSVFNSACNSVYFIMKQSDMYNTQREARIDYITASSYHKIQGSNPEHMPIPAEVDDAVKATLGMPHQAIEAKYDTMF